MNAAPRTRALDRLLSGFASAVPPVHVSGLEMDSRRLRAGEAFIAVRGRREHGLRHLAQALSRGAGAVVWEPGHDVETPHLDIPCVAVERLGWHVGEIAARFYDEPASRMFVAGVTGTDGKTSTAHLVAQALEQLGRPCAYLGTLGVGRLDRLDEATHTTPDPIALQARLAGFVEAGIEACAMEVSSHALDQNRVGGIAFDAVVLTNLTRDHLDYHHTVEHYAAAKRRLFEAADDRALILNRDDAHGAEWIAQLQSQGQGDRLCVYGLEGDRPDRMRHVIGRDLMLDESGLGLRLETRDAACTLRSRLLGRFNAYNLLAAAAVLIESGTTLEQAASALAACRTVPGRIEGFRAATGAGPLVVVDYAHTPKALEQVLVALRAHAQGRLVCVFGCGGDRDAGKRPLMGAAAARLADRVIVTDDNPRGETPSDITDQILAGIDGTARDRIAVEHDRGRAIRLAVSEARAGDVVLVAGKGHETTQTYGREVRDFSDRAFVAGLLAGRA